MPFEIVVVDNGSSDRTASVVDAWACDLPHVRLVRCDRRGVNLARNRGASASRGPLILCCDADDVPERGWLDAMARALDTVDVCGGTFDTERLNAPRVAATRRNPAADSLPVAAGRSYALGASLGFRRVVFDAIGGFDDDFVFGGDDIDFCWRAQDAGFRIALAPGALTFYRYRATLRTYFGQYMRYEMGAAQVDAKRIASGQLERIPPRMQARTLARRSLAALRIDRFVRPEERWAYVRRVAVLVGSVRALGRYRTIGDVGWP